MHASSGYAQSEGMGFPHESGISVFVPQSMPKEFVSVWLGSGRSVQYSPSIHHWERICGKHASSGYAQSEGMGFPHEFGIMYLCPQSMPKEFVSVWLGSRLVNGMILVYGRDEHTLCGFQTACTHVIAPQYAQNPIKII
ncbi:hypothetical protein CEXT_95031 [Caerostris extrusa]|uniref:Uncharacterized protein n=1 Tax=Caerostris extrusa TaxID=172846 RepID=A0AAV4PDD5_CAEEX|nr:hypothetical protein CEXT_95031 [Caerostris extrusa]